MLLYYIPLLPKMTIDFFLNICCFLENLNYFYIQINLESFATILQLHF